MARGKKKAKKTSNLIWGVIAGVVIGLAVILFLCLRGTEQYDYVVETNAFFAPFEFYEDRKIVGVDIEIIDRVAKKLDAKIDVKNVEFDVIIDNVANGVIADAGAAGLTITPARAEKVDFSIPYYTSVQYVIFRPGAGIELRDDYVVWEALAGRKLGTQTGSTGYLFMSDEISEGVLAGTGAEAKGFDSHQLAADAIASNIVDAAVADELAAKFIVDKNPGLVAYPLYYASDAGDYPVEESYAVAVNKERPELLTAFNEVLTEMLKVGPDGRSEMDRLILKYMGLLNE